VQSATHPPAWAACLTAFERELTPQQFATWIRPLACANEAGRLRLTAPNRFVLQWVKERFGGRIEALARQGMAIILSTHDPDQAFRCCDKVVLLHRGRMLAQAAPEEAITPAALKTLYGVDVQVIEIEAAGRRLRVCAPAGN